MTLYPTILCILLILFSCLVPTSSRGSIFAESWKNYLYYFGYLTILTVFSSTRCKFSKTNIYIFIFVTFYLIVASINSYYSVGGEFSLARTGPVIAYFYIVSLKKEKSIKKNVLLKFLIVLILFILIVNTLSVTGNSTINQFLVDNYSQFRSHSVSYAISESKPVFTFGVHSFASFYYATFGLLLHLLKSEKNKILYFFLQFGLLFMILLCKSSSAILCSVWMTYLIFKDAKGYFTKNALILILITSLLIVSAVAIEQIEATKNNISSYDHGLLARYVEFNNLFEDNFVVLEKTIFGIGFTIPRNYAVTYTDSGYVVYYTMGKVILVLFVVFTLVRFVFENYQNDRFLILSLLLAFELAIPNLIYPKTLALLTVLALLGQKSKKISSNQKKLITKNQVN